MHLLMSKKVSLFIVGGEIPLKGKQHKVWLHIIYKGKLKISRLQLQRQLKVNFKRIIVF